MSNEKDKKHESEKPDFQEEELLEVEETVEEETVVITKEQELENKNAQLEEQYVRLLAEYDNFRKRSQKEKEDAWNRAKSDTASAFLPVYDNLSRALKQETEDKAYAKGVQMTMDQLKSILDKLSIEEIPALGEEFNPEKHNAVMHIEDENLGTNVVAEVFEAGFESNGKVIRFAMVKVAN